MWQERSVAKLSGNVIFLIQMSRTEAFQRWRCHIDLLIIYLWLTMARWWKGKKSICGKNTCSHACETQEIYRNCRTTGDRREPLHTGRGWTAPWLTRQKERGRQVEELMNVSGHGEKEAAPQQLLPRLPSVVSAGTHTKARPACPITWTGLATGELLKLR